MGGKVCFICKGTTLLLDNKKSRNKDTVKYCSTYHDLWDPLFLLGRRKRIKTDEASNTTSETFDEDEGSTDVVIFFFYDFIISLKFFEFFYKSKIYFRTQIRTLTMSPRMMKEMWSPQLLVRKSNVSWLTFMPIPYAGSFFFLLPYSIRISLTR